MSKFYEALERARRQAGRPLPAAGNRPSGPAQRATAQNPAVPPQEVAAQRPAASALAPVASALAPSAPASDTIIATEPLSGPARAEDGSAPGGAAEAPIPASVITPGGRGQLEAVMAPALPAPESEERPEPAVEGAIDRAHVAIAARLASTVAPPADRPNAAPVVAYPPGWDRRAPLRPSAGISPWPPVARGPADHDFSWPPAPREPQPPSDEELGRALDALLERPPEPPDTSELAPARHGNHASSDPSGTPQQLDGDQASPASGPNSAPFPEPWMSPAIGEADGTFDWSALDAVMSDPSWEAGLPAAAPVAMGSGAEELARLRQRLIGSSRGGADTSSGDTTTSMGEGADIDWHRRAQFRWLAVEVVFLVGLAVVALVLTGLL